MQVAAGVPGVLASPVSSMSPWSAPAPGIGPYTAGASGQSAELAVAFQPLSLSLHQSCRFFMGANHASSPVIGGAGSYLCIPAVSVFKAHADPSLCFQIYVLSPDGVTCGRGTLKRLF